MKKMQYLSDELNIITKKANAIGFDVKLKYNMDGDRETIKLLAIHPYDAHECKIWDSSIHQLISFEETINIGCKRFLNVLKLKAKNVIGI